jgi:hypothetical protein
MQWHNTTNSRRYTVAVLGGILGQSYIRAHQTVVCLAEDENVSSTVCSCLWCVSASEGRTYQDPWALTAIVGSNIAAGDGEFGFH